MDRKIIIGLILGFLMLGTACSRMQVAIPVMHPAEVDLRGKDDAVLDRIDGRGGEEIEGYLRQLLADSPTVRLRTGPRSRPGRYQTEVRTGPQPEGSILIQGQVLEYGYKEHLSQSSDTCTRRIKREGKYVDEEYTCLHYRRRGQARVRASFEVVDQSTGLVIASKTAGCVEAEETEATDATPDYIDDRAMLAKCSRQTAFEFHKTISPWTETVQASFYKDGDLPMLEKGIELARAGLWDQAISQFKNAVDAAVADPRIKPKTTARAHWDLGLAYEYTGRFDLAVLHLRRAYQLEPEKEYLREIGQVEKLREEKARLKEQLEDREEASNPSGPPRPKAPRIQ
ncbi:MAG: tetratricopeptide repeat protein [Thermodesulfobacteriota bacterium]